MDRRLAAILATDVVGYSRHMERDEQGTYERLVSGRKELFEPEIAKHRGRWRLPTRIKQDQYCLVPRNVPR